MLEPEQLPDNPYLLLTPGPLSTTKSVKAVMLRDWCTWDADYNEIVQQIRRTLTTLASDSPGQFTSALMQGSGTFCVESVIGTALPAHGKLLVLANGAYGQRIAEMASYLRIALEVHDSGELAPPDLDRLQQALARDRAITHVAMVHCETTTGMLNPVAAVGQRVKSAGRVFIVDAMSSFGGIPMTMEDCGADFLISSANKCIQGVPGFGFVIARREAIAVCAGQARSLSLDLHAQWKQMEEGNGKWRFTSPTHVVRAFAQALVELAAEGGVSARHRRYQSNQRTLVSGMRELGFRTLLDDALQSPIITAFHSPAHPRYAFARFYQALKQKGFVIYPGKVTAGDTFRIGNIGDVHPADIARLLNVIAGSRYWLEAA